jgi:hypothetical protein
LRVDGIRTGQTPLLVKWGLRDGKSRFSSPLPARIPRLINAASVRSHTVLPDNYSLLAVADFQTATLEVCMCTSSSERSLHYHLSAAADAWGQVRPVRSSRQNGLWRIDATQFDQPLAEADDDQPDLRRNDRISALQHLEQSGRLTTREAATLRRLVVEGASFADIAAADGCSRQAVVARLVGNSLGQGGLLRKCRLVLTGDSSTEPGSHAPRAVERAKVDSSCQLRTNSAPEKMTKSHRGRTQT